jgi:hypothetical protein
MELEVSFPLGLLGPVYIFVDHVEQVSKQLLTVLLI